MKVLIAEDELVTRTVMARAVVHAGHEVATAPDGREMLRVCSEFKPQVLLVDWQMPVLNGVDAIREFRERPDGQEAFVILVTGINGDLETAEALEAGIDDYVLKPISAPRLRVVLKLTEARLNSRRRPALRGGPIRGPRADEIAASFGPVIALDASGRISFASVPLPGCPAVGRSFEEGLNPQDATAFANASVTAAETRTLAEFQASVGTTSRAVWGVQAIYRGGELVGFVLGERDRMGPAAGLASAANG